jgi:hypothetical protein
VLLGVALERRPGAKAVLDGDDVQRVGEHEAPLGALAERGAGAGHGGFVTRGDGAQEALRRAAVLLDPGATQLVMQFLVHDDLLEYARRPLSRAGGAGTRTITG